jgi:hypothetical protein
MQNVLLCEVMKWDFRITTYLPIWMNRSKDTSNYTSHYFDQYAVLKKPVKYNYPWTSLHFWLEWWNLCLLWMKFHALLSFQKVYFTICKIWLYFNFRKWNSFIDNPPWKVYLLILHKKKIQVVSHFHGKPDSYYVIVLM